MSFSIYHFFFFFNDTATTEIYTLSLHDALPIFSQARTTPASPSTLVNPSCSRSISTVRSEEHTSELQSLRHLVCRLLLEKKKKKQKKKKKENKQQELDDKYVHNTHETNWNNQTK